MIEGGEGGARNFLATSDATALELGGIFSIPLPGEAIFCPRSWLDDGAEILCINYTMAENISCFNETPPSAHIKST